MPRLQAFQPKTHDKFCKVSMLVMLGTLALLIECRTSRSRWLNFFALADQLLLQFWQALQLKYSDLSRISATFAILQQLYPVAILRALSQFSLQVAAYRRDIPALRLP